jgi:hypothetical protein
MFCVYYDIDPRKLNKHKDRITSSGPSLIRLTHDS